MEKPIETIDYRGYTVEIYQDIEPIDPIEYWDMLGTIVCWHKHYSLGHDQPKLEPNEFLERLAIEADPNIESKIEYWSNSTGWIKIRNKHEKMDMAAKEVDQILYKLIQKAINKHYIILPIYMYDHSGITIRTSPFSCPWDSGQIGYIYVSIDEIKSEHKNWKIITKSRKEYIKRVLQSEIKAYDQFLTGDVYGYIVNDPVTGNHIDSCWGFYGDDWKENNMHDHFEPAIDRHIDETEQYKNEMYAMEIDDMSQLTS
jgi:hypothetical protein